MTAPANEAPNNVEHLVTATGMYSRLRDLGFRPIEVHGFDEDTGACTCTKPDCPSVGKHPVRSGWTTSPVSEQDLPDHYNVGLACGSQPNGKFLVAIDIDDLEKAEATLSAIGIGIDDTYTQVTPSGGIHAIFSISEGTDRTLFRNSVRNKDLGFDIRAQGGQVVFAGSANQKGSYRAQEVVTLDAFQALTAEQAKALAKVCASKDGEAEASQPEAAPDLRAWQEVGLGARYRTSGDLYVRSKPPAIQGDGGDAATWQVALHLVRGLLLDPDTALDVMLPWNRTCQPPWALADLERKLEDARDCGIVPWGFALNAEGTCPLESPHGKVGPKQVVLSLAMVPASLEADEPAIYTALTTKGTKIDRTVAVRFLKELGRAQGGSFVIDSVRQVFPHAVEAYSKALQRQVGTISNTYEAREWLRLTPWAGRLVQCDRSSTLYLSATDEEIFQVIEPTPLPPRKAHGMIELNEHLLEQVKLAIYASGVKLTLPTGELMRAFSSDAEPRRLLLGYYRKCRRDWIAAGRPSLLKTWVLEILHPAGHVPANYWERFGQAYMTGAVARTLATLQTPSKFDVHLVLYSAEQGLGKTSFVNELLPHGYVCTYPSGNPEVVRRQLSMAYVVNDDEAMALSEHAAEIKSLITEEKFTVRVLYSNDFSERPASHVVVSTANTLDLPALNDSSGSRRQWVVSVLTPIDLKRWLELRELLWGEAYDNYLHDQPARGVKPNWVLTMDGLGSTNRSLTFEAKRSGWNDMPSAWEQDVTSRSKVQALLPFVLKGSAGGKNFVPRATARRWLTGDGGKCPSLPDFKNLGLSADSNRRLHFMTAEYDSWLETLAKMPAAELPQLEPGNFLERAEYLKTELPSSPPVLFIAKWLHGLGRLKPPGGGGAIDWTVT